MGYRIRKLRKERKMSQQELSEKSGVSRTIISFLESGKSIDTHLSTLQRIADCLEVPIHDLFLP